MSDGELTVRGWLHSDESKYDDLLASAPDAMFNHSGRYLQFLSRALGTQAHPCHFVATRKGRLVGALPAFVRDGPLGPVVNSLPFFGSHGGAMVLPNETRAVRSALSQAFDRYCDSINAFSSTVIDSPIRMDDGGPSPYRANILDDRVGQISVLPEATSAQDAELQLIKQCHSKTRNLVRKGLKGGFKVTRACSEQAMHSLWDLHVNNMSSISGLAKPWQVFEAIMDSFEAEKDYHVYLALADKEVAAALLVFYFKNTVEYFSPAIAPRHRSNQPLNALILRVMTDAILERRARQWNWGGTWRSQDGVYHFKSRWGANDHVYRYHIHARLPLSQIGAAGVAALRVAYPHFYTVPFALLVP
jgi:hypothetical protein